MQHADRIVCVTCSMTEDFTEAGCDCCRAPLDDLLRSCFNLDQRVVQGVRVFATAMLCTPCGALSRTGPMKIGG